MIEVLDTGLEMLGMSQESPDRRTSLLRYLSELRLWNRKLGLVEAEGDELVVRHVLDCLTPLSIIKSNSPGTVADLGSGAGLPGIPLAIYMDSSEFALVERSGRRVGFLKNVVALLRLKNVSIYESDFTRHTPTQAAQAGYDLISFRAFRPFSEDLIVGIRRILSPGGVVAAYKGRDENVAEDARLLQAAGAVTETIPLEVPFLKHERNLLLARFPSES
ncbi:MAG: 16S rRNA (guanine(527)-N(7))-methyltransferase RsmG [Spirochaetaceae bacterium]|nr:MAG: 16S rRNA (guanine(527)-N(7))-methyltransferase RsmG [Spirochaetaceae bacterium]